VAAPAPLTVAQRRALAKLRQAGLLEGLVLVGGTAVAYHLGHRISNDLDLFSTDPSFDLDEVRRRAVASLDAETISQSDATLKLRLSDAVVDVVRYPFPSLGRSKTGVEGVKVASLRDLATMKLAAIAKRGVRRDYWDLYEILTRTRLTLRAACRDYIRKFGVSESDLYHVLRALSWFEDAEADPSTPRGLSRKKWREIREWFPRQAARELLRQAKL
jgi:predicted nucleotidyltransferase component of viral defense system